MGVVINKTASIVKLYSNTSCGGFHILQIMLYSLSTEAKNDINMFTNTFFKNQIMFYRVNRDICFLIIIKHTQIKIPNQNLHENSKTNFYSRAFLSLKYQELKALKFQVT